MSSRLSSGSKKHSWAESMSRPRNLILVLGNQLAFWPDGSGMLSIVPTPIKIMLRAFDCNLALALLLSVAALQASNKHLNAPQCLLSAAYCSDALQ